MDMTREKFSTLGTTGFSDKELNDILTIQSKPTPWSVGETFAECYLEDYHNSQIPYPHGRGLKNPHSEFAGIDIVGFFHVGNTTMFLLGEIKTSKEEKHPPRVVTGKNGLSAQINSIIISKEIRRISIRWLSLKIGETNSDGLLLDFIAAYKHNKFQTVGILIRSTNPDRRDIKSMLDKIQVEPNTHLDILALYLPITLNSFVDMVAL